MGKIFRVELNKNDWLTLILSLFTFLVAVGAVIISDGISFNLMVLVVIVVVNNLSLFRLLTMKHAERVREIVTTLKEVHEHDMLNMIAKNINDELREPTR